MKQILLLGLLLSTLAGCSEENAMGVLQNVDSTANKETLGDGSVPESKLIYKAMFHPDEYPLGQLDAMYRRDILATPPDYDANLKNMWYMILNEKIAKEGNMNLKEFYLGEQIKLNQNIANVEGFYKLLRSCASFKDVDEIFAISNQFYKKNKAFIENNIQWKDPAKKKGRLDDLMYQKLTFQRSMASDK